MATARHTSPAPRDSLEECTVRAASDRRSAAAANTINGRRKFEISALAWEQKAALLGRLNASLNTRERLNAEAVRYLAARSADTSAGVEAWESEGGTVQQHGSALSSESTVAAGSSVVNL